jgi:hypothetical protein
VSLDAADAFLQIPADASFLDGAAVRRLAGRVLGAT